MRLTFINTSKIWGGGEFWTYQTSSEFIDRNHEVTIVVRKDCALAQTLTGKKIPHLILPSDFNNFFRKHQLIKNMATHIQPQVLITNSGRDVALANSIRKYCPHSKIIFRRGLDRHLSNSIFNRKKYQKVDIIIVNSLSTFKTIRASFPWFPEKNIFKIYNPINVEKFLSYHKKDIRKELDIPEKAKVIGIFGRLTEQKGHIFILEALQEIIRIFPYTYLLIVGQGELESYLKSKVTKYKLTAKCKFVGHVSEVQPYYVACDLIVIPSLFEGFCYTAIEAQLLEKPVIAFRTSSFPEVIQNEVTGYLVTPGDIKALAACITYLFQNPARAGVVGQTGKEFVRIKFSSVSIYNQLENLLAHILNEHV